MHQETHGNFLEFFARKLERTWVQITRMEVCIATNSRKNERNPKPTVMKPKPTHPDGFGSPECLRGVGSIRILQDLNLTA